MNRSRKLLMGFMILSANFGWSNDFTLYCKSQAGSSAWFACCVSSVSDIAIVYDFTFAAVPSKRYWLRSSMRFEEPKI